LAGVVCRVKYCKRRTRAACHVSHRYSNSRAVWDYTSDNGDISAFTSSRAGTRSLASREGCKAELAGVVCRVNYCKRRTRAACHVSHRYSNSRAVWENGDISAFISSSLLDR